MSKNDLKKQTMSKNDLKKQTMSKNDLKKQTISKDIKKTTKNANVYITGMCFLYRIFPYNFVSILFIL